MSDTTGQADTDTPPEPKPANPHHVRRDFYRLATDWIHLRQMPSPVRGATTRKPAYRISGHPAEWASDHAALIAHLLWSWHDLVAEARNERNPPPLSAAEQVRVAKAWTYLEPRIDQLCDIVRAEALGELATLHRKIQRELGATYRREILPMPCPSLDCGKRALVREHAVGRDLIACGACNYRVREEYYPLLVRIALDAALDTATATATG